MNSPASMTQSTPDQLRSFWQTEQQRIESELHRWLPEETGDLKRLNAAMRHGVLNGGKRLRPILVLASYTSLGGKDMTIYPVAAAVEILHSYSLIHDDLPCMDDDDQRRGRPTVHVAFDEATAVLAGDALHALAFEILGRHAAPDVIIAIAHAVGLQGMVGGQMCDLIAEGETATEELVRSIHVRKTGALIAACVQAGAMMADADDKTLAALRQYGEPLGLSFQITDDILELTQTAAALGKPVGSDLKHNKVTYPSAIGLDKSKQLALHLSDQAKSALTPLPVDTSLLLSLADFVVGRES